MRSTLRSFIEADLLCFSDKLKDLDSCSRNCKHLWDAFGRWTNDKWRPYLEGKQQLGEKCLLRSRKT